MRTPWGTADSIVRLPHGIIAVTTPSHGGYYVPIVALRAIPARFQAYAARFSGSPQWYEEDCAWACVAVTYPDAFPPEAQAHARDVIARYVDRPQV